MSSELLFRGGNTTGRLVVRASPRARRLRLKVDPRTGDVLLSVPRRVSHRRALAWATSQRAWIEAALADIPAARPLEPGATIPLYGEPHRIEWQEGTSRTVRVESGCIACGGPRDRVSARLLRWLKQHAHQRLSEETAEFAALAGTAVERVGVGDPVSRWGSCSARGTIRYSWRLILVPSWVRRAIVAHEVAHRIHMDHGPGFHALVGQLLGADPKPASQWLRRHGASLHRFARL